MSVVGRNESQMVPEARPVELWALRADDYGEVTSSEIIENRKYERKNRVIVG